MYATDRRLPLSYIEAVRYECDEGYTINNIQRQSSLLADDPWAEHLELKELCRGVVFMSKNVDFQLIRGDLQILMQMLEQLSIPIWLTACVRSISNFGFEYVFIYTSDDQNIDEKMYHKNVSCIEADLLKIINAFCYIALVQIRKVRWINTDYSIRLLKFVKFCQVIGWRLPNVG